MIEASKRQKQQQKPKNKKHKQKSNSHNAVEKVLRAVRAVAPARLVALTSTPYKVIPNRVEAIHYAMDYHQGGDMIVLAGKGHETYQEINHVKHHLDEREVVAEHID